MKTPELNKVIIAGNVTRDPEIREVRGGNKVLELSIAATNSFRKKDGTYQKDTCFISVVVWNKTAEACAQYLSKGSPVLVEGSLTFESWESQDGKKQSRIKIKGDHVQFLGEKKDEERDDGPDDDYEPASAAEVGF